MMVVEIIVDSLVIFLSLGLSFYAYYLSRVFRGGIMEKPFRILALAPLFFMIGESMRLLEVTGILAEFVDILHSVGEGFFIVVLFYGFSLLSSIWRSKKLGQTT